MKIMGKVDKELDKENILDKVEGKDQEWKILAQKGDMSVWGLYKNYVGWDKEELAEIRIKFRDDDE